MCGRVYIPFSLKKKYFTRRKAPLGKAMLEMVNSWTIKADEKKDSEHSINIQFDRHKK